MPRYKDIKPYTSYGGYAVDVGLDFLPQSIERFKEEYGLELEPDFQRGHVWNTEQRSRFVEHILREGRSGRDILFNCPGWNRGPMGRMVLVDGLQRITSMLMYMRNELPVFGHYHREYEDRIRYITTTMRFHVNDLRTRAEVLQWYIDINAGGVVHSDDEIERVRKMLDAENSLGANPC